MNNNEDYDFIYMQMVDLYNDINNESLSIGSQKQYKICKILTQRVQSKNNEINELAIKCCEIVAKKFQNTKAINDLLIALTTAIDQLNNNNNNNNNKHEASMRCLMVIIPVLNIDDYLSTYDFITKHLLELCEKQHDYMLWNVLETIFLHHGKKLESYHQKALSLLGENTLHYKKMPKSIINCLGSLSKCISIDIFENYVNILLSKLTENNNNNNSVLQLVTTFVRSSGNRFTAQFTRHMINILSEYTRSLEQDDNKSAIRELCFLAIDSIISNCVHINVDDINILIISITNGIRYNPNIDNEYESESENEFSGFEDDGDDDNFDDGFISEEDEDGNFSDDEDESFMVRRSAIKCIKSIIDLFKTRYLEEPLRLMRKDNWNPIVPYSPNLCQKSKVILKHLIELMFSQCIDESAQEVKINLILVLGEALNVFEESNNTHLIDLNKCLKILIKSLTTSRKKQKEQKSVAYIINIINLCMNISLKKTKQYFIEESVDILKVMIDITNEYTKFNENITITAHLHDNIQYLIDEHAFKCIDLCFQQLSSSQQHLSLLSYIPSLIPRALNASRSNVLNVALTSLEVILKVIKYLLCCDQHIDLPTNVVDRVGVICNLDDPWTNIIYGKTSITEESCKNKCDNDVMESIKNIEMTYLNEIQNNSNCDVLIRCKMIECLSYTCSLGDVNNYLQILQVYSNLFVSSSTRIVSVKAIARTCQFLLIKNNIIISMEIMNLFLEYFTVICSYIRQTDTNLAAVSLAAVYRILQIFYHSNNFQNVNDQIIISMLLPMFIDPMLQQKERTADEHELWLHVLYICIKLLGKNNNKLIDTSFEVLQLEFQWIRDKNINNDAINRCIVNIFELLGELCTGANNFPSHFDNFMDLQIMCEAQCRYLMKTNNKDKLIAATLNDMKSNHSFFTLAYIASNMNINDITDANNNNNNNVVKIIETLINAKNNYDHNIILRCLSIIGTSFPQIIDSMIFNNNSKFSSDEIVVVVDYLMKEFFNFSNDAHVYWISKSAQIINTLLSFNDIKHEEKLISAIANVLIINPDCINVESLINMNNNNMQTLKLLKSINLYITQLHHIQIVVSKFGYAMDRKNLLIWSLKHHQFLSKFQNVLLNLLEKPIDLSIIEELFKIILNFIVSFGINSFNNITIDSITKFTCQCTHLKSKVIVQQFGPIEKKIDQGLIIRKLAWNCMDVLFKDVFLCSENDQYDLKKVIEIGFEDKIEARTLAQLFFARCVAHHLIANENWINQFIDIIKLNSTMNIDDQMTTENISISFESQHLENFKKSAEDCINIIKYVRNA